MINIIPIIASANKGAYPSAMYPTGNYWTVDGAANDLAFDIGNQVFYGPNCWYQNGRTYYALRQNHVAHQGRVGMLEYYNGSYSFEFFNQNPTGIDYHDEPVFQMDSTGIITLIHAQHDGTDDYNDVWQMTSPYDITSFTKLSNAPNKTGNYPKFYYINDSLYFLIGRALTSTSPVDQWDLNITTFDGSTWGTPKTLIDVDPEGTNSIFYPFSMNGMCNDNGWYYIRWSKRIGADPIVLYRDFYMAKCHKDDINIWYSLDENFSKDISTEGAITETEANTYMKYMANTLEDNLPIGGSYIKDSTIRIMQSQDNINKTFYFNGTSWSSINSDLKPRQIINESIKQSITESSDDTTLDLYRTNDFQTFEKTNTLLTQGTDLIKRVNIPMNYREIPKGQKFCIFACSNKWPSENIVTSTNSNDLYIIEMIK